MGDFDYHLESTAGKKGLMANESNVLFEKKVKAQRDLLGFYDKNSNAINTLKDLISGLKVKWGIKDLEYERISSLVKQVLSFELEKNKRQILDEVRLLLRDEHSQNFDSSSLQSKYKF